MFMRLQKSKRSNTHTMTIIEEKERTVGAVVILFQFGVALPIEPSVGSPNGQSSV
jgi:hypothetical protein